MAESQSADETEMELSENIRVALDEEQDYGEGPHFFSPYPASLVQVRRPDTRGGRDVVKIINQHWPANIDELEDLSRDEYEDGYSGSFIRNVLRSHYIPADQFDGNGSTQRSNLVEPGEAPEEEIIVERTDEEMPVGEAEWHRIFRYGIRLALEGNVSEEEAINAFNSGFIEGVKLGKEMDIDHGGQSE